MATHLPAGLSPDSVDVRSDTERRQLNPTINNNTNPSSSTTTNQQQHPHPLSHAPNSNTGTTPKPHHPGGTSTTTGPTTTTTSNPDPDAQLLSVKELPSATDGLKHKLQRARAAVRTLGDVRRAVAQQEAEMRALEGRRAAQARALARAQADGSGFCEGGGAWVVGGRGGGGGKGRGRVGGEGDGKDMLVSRGGERETGDGGLRDKKMDGGGNGLVDIT
ncbi:predicted protein [Chaetomium globosum CBS 148.51]|uniref:Mediator of RNA polymerase II transcription subunit 9 n=1 Tax=Chaetomium globosum (strain ATCC 6205 / CBS 148.51 / DSM 1962 / NBRC 6347 / NRRL 1970) TaxID=306901 RepID=Q2GQX2_CHAGB|nr:uncharacterized protein CHGG_09632 [Chaetomium globosum CBS 148.51]EAQ83228.1 predicted protein [Chaetomium globosum CBS 148.51]